MYVKCDLFIRPIPVGVVKERLDDLQREFIEKVFDILQET